MSHPEWAAWSPPSAARTVGPALLWDLLYKFFRGNKSVGYGIPAPAWKHRCSGTVSYTHLLSVAGGETPGGERNAQLYRAAQAGPESAAEALMLLIDEERGTSLSAPEGAEAVPPEPTAPAIPAIPAGLVMQPCGGLEPPP